MLVYQSGALTETDVRALSEGEIGFVCLVKPTDEEVERVVGGIFGCHPLAVADCKTWEQHPHLDVYDDHLYMSFYVWKHRWKLYEMSVVMGHNYVVVIFPEQIPFFDEVNQGLKRTPRKMESTGMLLYEMLNSCVRHYSDLVDAVEDRVDEMENQIYENPYAKLAPRIFKMKRNLHKVRRVVAEERNVLNALMHTKLLQEEDTRYLADVLSHVSQAVEMVDAFRDSLTGLLELQMSIKGDKMNEIMKTLTIVNTVFLPMMFVVGLYGTNIHLPEYNWAKNYWWLWGWLIVSAVFMLVFIKRKKWI